MSTTLNKSTFFSPSDEAHKHRRNLLIVSSLCIIHFFVKPINSLRIFEVTFDASFLNFGLLAALVWFAANYFYYLYADYMQWKSKHMSAEHIHIMPPGRIYSSYLPSVVHASNGELHLQMLPQESSSFHLRPQHQTDFTELEIQVRAVVERLAKEYQDGMRLDTTRIERFNDAILKYHFANRLRFYILDIGVPLGMTVTSILTAIIKFFN